MEYIFSDLKTDRPWAWLSLVLCGVLVVVICVSPISQSTRGWMSIAAYICLSIFFLPSLIKASHDHKHLLTVCVWSFVLVVLGIVVTFFAFFSVAGSHYAKYDKLLNVVPVFVAIWAAGLGWLINFRITSKAHRTNNSFSIVMELRKSTELLKRFEMVGRHFPPKSSIPEDYVKYFSSDVLRRQLEEAGWDMQAVPMEQREKAEAVRALGFVLNYFEFMAAGLKAGDLDESLLLDTISPTVIGMYKRSKNLVDYVRTAAPGGAGQPLAYECLEALCLRWEQMIGQRELSCRSK